MLYHYDGSFDGFMTAVYDAFYARIPVAQAHFLAATDAASDTPGVAGANGASGMNAANAANPFSGIAEAVVPMTLWDSCVAPEQAAAARSLSDHPDTGEVSVETSPTKAKKVIRALISQVSYDAYTCCYHAHLSCYPNRGDLIFQYVKLCFAVGPGVMQMWGHPVASEVMRMARRVTRENQHMLGFLRFQELDSGALFAEISPTNNLLELMAPHFSDRLSGENWLIYDSARKIACVHQPGKEVLFTDQIPPELIALKEHSAAEPMYQDLWRAFFKAIAIEGRYNPKCQQNLMPKKYWKHMTEMQSQSE